MTTHLGGLTPENVRQRAEAEANALSRMKEATRRSKDGNKYYTVIETTDAVLICDSLLTMAEGMKFALEQIVAKQGGESAG